MHAQVLGGCGGLFYAWWMFWASDSMKATLEETTAPVIGLLLSAASWVKECVQAMIARITGAPSRSHAELCTLSSPQQSQTHTLPSRLLKERMLLTNRWTGWQCTYGALAAHHAGRQRRADAAEAFFQPLASGDFGLDGNDDELGHAPPVLR